MKLLLDPARKVDEKTRAMFWNNMAGDSDSMDAVWSVFRAQANQLPANGEMLETFMISPYRSELDRMVQDGKLNPQLSEQARALAKRGASQTLSDISEQQHDFLVRRGYVSSP